MARSVIVIGLGFGDEAKGACVDKLTRTLDADLIVRFGGGCQTAHNVITPEGVHHTFSQFGSGMMANAKVRTHLSEFTLIQPLAMMNEYDHLRFHVDDLWNRITVDARCIVITPYHKALNRLEEDARGVNRHGSCGLGVGWARKMHLHHGDQVLLAGDLKDESRTRKKLDFIFEVMQAEIKNHPEFGPLSGPKLPSIYELVERYWEWPAKVTNGFDGAEVMIFEGHQGVLLDETHGTQPHVTWTDTTFNNAMTILNDLGVSDRIRMGCLRTYHTRHGAGPLPREDQSLVPLLPEPHNGVGRYQGAFRVGTFDWESAKESLEIVGEIDLLSISHIDRLSVFNQTRGQFCADLGERLGVKIGMMADGPTADHRSIHSGWIWK